MSLHKHSWKIDNNPEKKPTVCVVRYGAFGDTVQAASVCAALKKAGYHVTLMCSFPSSEVVALDPNIDAKIVQLTNQVPPAWLGQMWVWFSKKWMGKGFDKWVNLCESVETTLLAMEGNIRFEWSPTARHQMMNVNYLEWQHKLAGVPYEPQFKFYPTPEESKWCLAGARPNAKGRYTKFCIVEHGRLLPRPQTLPPPASHLAACAGSLSWLGRRHRRRRIMRGTRDPEARAADVAHERQVDDPPGVHDDGAGGRGFRPGDRCDVCGRFLRDAKDFAAHALHCGKFITRLGEYYIDMGTGYVVSWPGQERGAGLPHDAQQVRAGVSAEPGFRSGAVYGGDQTGVGMETPSNSDANGPGREVGPSRAAIIESLRMARGIVAYHNFYGCVAAIDRAIEELSK